MKPTSLHRAFLAAAPADTEAKYEKALKLHKRLRYSRKGSPEFKYAMALGQMIEAYEDEHSRAPRSPRPLDGAADPGLRDRAL